MGYGSKPTDIGPKVFTTAVLLTGMVVALYVIKAGGDPVPAIIAAQAVTVIAAPLVAGALLWMTNRKDIMGETVNGPVTNILAGAGLLLILAMAWYTATVTIPEKYEKWNKSKQEQSANTVAVSDQNLKFGDNSPNQATRPRTSFKTLKSWHPKIVAPASRRYERFFL